MRTNSYSGSDAVEPSANGQACIDLRNVALRFIMYGDKHARFKEAVLSRLLSRRFSRMRPTEEFWALREIGLRIAQGERVGIIGANGAGKSTLLRLIAGIYQPTRGRIEIAGSVAPLIDLGAGFNHEVSARDNIILYGSLLGHDRREMEAKVEAILDFAGVRKFAGMPTKYYSTGMLRRLSFAAATDILPEILLVDEIFAGGDAEFRDKAKRRMAELIDTAKILVIVSHRLELIEELCERVIWLQEGRIVADGDPQTLCREYLQASLSAAKPGE